MKMSESQINVWITDSRGFGDFILVKTKVLYRRPYDCTTNLTNLVGCVQPPHHQIGCLADYRVRTLSGTTGLRCKPVSNGSIAGLHSGTRAVVVIARLLKAGAGGWRTLVA